MLAKVLPNRDMSIWNNLMNAPVINALISPGEIARRRKVVTAADWSMRMEGLGKQTPDYNALSELWITGQISKTELNARTKQMVTEFIRERGH
jgi:hypothetical protein